MSLKQTLNTLGGILRTERAQVVFILAVIMTSAFCTIRYVVVPQRAMNIDNLMVREQLESSKYARYSIIGMESMADNEAATLQQLSNEWFRIAAHLSSLQDSTPKGEGDVSRIEYKVELNEIRERLKSKSEELKIQLIPGDLGLDDEIKSNEDVRIRMRKLKAVEKLADLTLDRQIQRLVEIYPMPPVTHKDKSGNVIFEEYPVRVECDMDFEQLYTLFKSVFEENQLFVFRNLRIESGPTFDAKLRVKAVLSALLFK